MGLDAIEIVLRTEELYAITITDDEAPQVATVGDFYALICRKLDLTPLASPQTPDTLPEISRRTKAFLFGHTLTPLPPPASVLPWTSQTVWNTLVAIFVDMQGLKPHEIVPFARINKDLGID